MSRKILPLVVNPVLHCFFNFASSADLLFTYPQFKAWFYSNYIQKVSTPESCLWLSYVYAYKEAPMFSQEKISKVSMWELKIDTLAYFKNALDNGKYIFTSLNEHYLPFRPGKDDFFHDAFIYGYDDAQQIFFMHGYNHSQKYGKVTASFDEVREAFETSLEIDGRSGEYVYLLFPRTNIKFEFDLPHVYTLLCDYYNSTNCGNQELKYNWHIESEKRTLGMLCYKNIHEKFTYDLNVENDYGNRLLFLDLKEQIEIMLMRIDYMEKEGYIRYGSGIHNQYLGILSKVEPLLHIMIKYSITKNKKLERKLYEGLHYIENAEREAIPYLLNLIQQNLYSESALYALPEGGRKLLLQNKKYAAIITPQSSFIETEFVAGIYGKPFRREYLSIFSKKHDETSSIDIHKGEGYLDIVDAVAHYNSCECRNSQFLLLELQITQIPDCIYETYPDITFIDLYDFFILYRQACGFETTVLHDLSPSDLINTLSYSRQSGNCICNSSLMGDYLTLRIGSRLKYQFQMAGSFTCDKMIFYVGGVQSSGNIIIRRDFSEGEVLCTFDITEKDKPVVVNVPLYCEIRPRFGNRIDLFFEVIGSDDFSFDFYSYRFYNELEGENEFCISTEKISEIKNASLVPFDNKYSVVLYDSGMVLYKGIELNVGFRDLEFGINDEIEGILSITMDGQRKILHGKARRVSFECHKGKHDLWLSYQAKNEEALNVNSIRFCSLYHDISKISRTVEYDIIYNADKGFTEINQGYIHLTYNGSYIGFSKVDFFCYFKGFTIFASAEKDINAGNLEIRLDTLDGLLIGICKIRCTKDWDVFERFECEISPVRGVHDLYFVMSGEGKGNLFNLKKFIFE